MAIINGTSGNDVLEGTFTDDIIYGFGGDDAKRASNAWVAWFEKHLLTK